jgi:hypothetical protein
MFKVYILVDGLVSTIAAGIDDEQIAHTIFNATVADNAEESLYEVTIVMIDETDPETVVREETVCQGW